MPDFVSLFGTFGTVKCENNNSNTDNTANNNNNNYNNSYNNVEIDDIPAKRITFSFHSNGLTLLECIEQLPELVSQTEDPITTIIRLETTFSIHQ